MSWPSLKSLERNIERIPESGCWIWMGTLSGKGYGRAKLAGMYKNVHKATYEQIVGKVPSGLQLDHLCRVRCCCNPAHLEPVTCKENVRRGELMNVQKQRLLGMTHCKNGHPYDDSGHVYVRCDGRRQCRTCAIESQRNRRKAKRGSENGMA